jgi:dipeptidase E
MERNKIIILGGGGNSEQSKKLDTAYVEKFGITRILYIPIALQLNRSGYEDCFIWISDWIKNISNKQIRIDMCLDLSKDIDLGKYDSVYIGGGNTYELLYQIKINKWDRKLTSFYNNGGIIYGGSAGAIILGKTIETVPSEYLEKIEEVGTNGLNFVDYIIRCHYNKDINNEEVNLYLKNLQEKFDTNLLLLKEDEGLVITNGIASLIK